MYESFYGFRERPFDLTPNPRFLVMTDVHREALSNLEYGIASRTGITLLVGDAGTGKTTLIRAVIQDYEKQGALIAYLNNPTLTRPEFYEFLTEAFDLSAKAAASKATLLKELAQVIKTVRDIVAAQTPSVLEVEELRPRLTVIRVRLETHNRLEEDHLYNWPSLLFDKTTLENLRQHLQHELENLPPRFA